MQISRRQTGWLATLLGVVALASAGRVAVSSEPATYTMGPTDFGVAFVNSAEEVRGDPRIEKGMETGAVLDRFPLYWNIIETSAGQWNWNNQDAALRANERGGLGTLAILLGTPGHYYPADGGKSSPDEPPPMGGGLLTTSDSINSTSETCTYGQRPPTGLFEPIFADGSDQPGSGKGINPGNPWARFVREAVERYKPGGAAGTNVQYWEVWNEPDLCHFWSGDAREYARLLKVAYLVIKSSDPSATVLWGGLSHFDNANFLMELVDELKRDPMSIEHNGFFDVAASHHYSNVMLSYHYTKRVRDALASAGWDWKAVWITESGVPVCGDYPGPDCRNDLGHAPYRASPEEQASYIWQNVAYTRIAGGGPIFHFQLYDDAGNECRSGPPADGFGLITNEPGAPCTPHLGIVRPAFQAFQLATRYFPDTELLWHDIQEGAVRRVAFYHPEQNERRLLLWSITGSDGVARVPAVGDSARLVGIDGSEVTIQPQNGEYQIQVPKATNQNDPTAPAVYTIGGKPYLLLENDTTPPIVDMELDAVSTRNFELGWSVSDLGSGVADTVDLWIQVGDGAWQLWLAGQPSDGETLVAGEPGQRYRFSAIAADRAGNALKEHVAYAETVVEEDTQEVTVTGQILNSRGEAAAWAPLAIGGERIRADAHGNFSVKVLTGRWDVAVNGKVVRNGQRFDADTSLSLLLPPATDALTNGDWEDGLTDWSTPSGESEKQIEQRPETEDSILRLASAFVPTSGIEGEEESPGGNSTIAQTIQVPPGQPYLALDYKVESEESEPDHDRFEIIIAEEGRPAAYLHVQESASDWAYRFFDLSPYAGKTVTLLFNVYESSPNRRTSVLLGDVMVGEPTIFEPPQDMMFLPVIAR